MKLDERIAILKALADPSRASVINALLCKPHCVEELAARLRRAPSTISFHLRKLEEANLVTKTKSQYYLVYEARTDVLDLRLRDLVQSPDQDSAEQARMRKHRQKVLSTFLRNGKLLQIPKQWRKKMIILEEFLALFEPGQSYEEAEVNQRILKLYPDYCTIRRMLIDEGFMTREGQTYQCAEKAITEDVSRAELKRQYKETPKEAGIFLITNRANGKVLLGSSLNLHGPLNKHRFILSLGKHWNSQLQEDWNRFGKDNFTFEIVQVVKRKDDPEFNCEEELARLERIWLEKTQPVGDRGYNKDDRIRE